MLCKEEETRRARASGEYEETVTLAKEQEQRKGHGEKRGETKREMNRKRKSNE